MSIPKNSNTTTMSKVRSLLLLCFFVVMFVLLPAIVTIGIYARILVIVRQRITLAERLSGFKSSFPSLHKTKQRSDRKASLTFFLVTISFVVTWMPFFIINIYRSLDSDTFYPELEIISYLTFASSHWLTSVVFVSRDASFRNAVQRLLRVKRPQNNRYLNSDLKTAGNSEEIRL